ncbi:MAG: type II CRISPR RNA-guided endonuclease Cas9 [Oscillospiraceae bacterium]|nr:type II CRISPR RNA-guided endonuclease Cas9 [Oscillospiraceae bacterium]
MLPYAIGLDIGISSVGWAAVTLDGEDKPCGIIGMGSRIFDAAEQPKTGDSLAAPRREARSGRRRLRRRRHRKERIRALILREKLLDETQLATLFNGKLEDIYALRVRALDEAVTAEELAKIMLHLSQRRGFRSNRRSAASKEDGELLAAVSANRARMLENGYRTAGEMLLKDAHYQEHRRNKGGAYISTVGRDMTEDEVRQIFSAQRRLGNAAASELLEAAFLEILLSQRSFDAGPGEPSPYAGSQIENMVGKCTLEPDESRAARATYSFEYFALLEAVNHIRLTGAGEIIPLTADQRERLIALAHKTADLSYAKIRKELGIPTAQRFNMVSYGKSDSPDEAEKKTKLKQFKAYHQMRGAFEKVCKGSFVLLTKEQRNAIGQTLSIYKTGDNIRRALREAGLSEPQIDIAESLSFSGFGNLSVKACDKLIPYLEQGMNYNDACAAADYDFRAHGGQEKKKLLAPLNTEAKDTITSPVVLRAVSQTIKVVNAIIRERGGSPTFINIELAREMAKDFSERTQIKREHDENQKRNERLMERIKNEYGKSAPTGLDLVKLKLYEEQAGVCAYSLKQMSLEHLFDPNYAEIDHIIPYSISFDDGYKNKVLVLAKENRDKGNRLPLEYLNGKRREDFIVWVNSAVRDWKKRQCLLKEQITPEDEARFKERNLQDTKTASRFLLNYIADNLAFAPFQTGRKKHVTAVNGSVTAYLRKRWGITKTRANGDLHHAVDALVIACTTDGLIQKVSRYAQYQENRYSADGGLVVDLHTGEVVAQFPEPWPYFRQELEARLSDDPARAVRGLGLAHYATGEIRPRPLFVSRMPHRKITGAAHKETIKSPRALDEGLLVTRTPLNALKLDKDGEIAGYYKPESDRLLYEALKERLRQFGGDGKKAFAEPFHKPKHDGTPGPLVTKVKLCEPTTLSVAVHGGLGVANNDSMVRIDVFHVEGDGYYFVPIYIADTLKPELPDRACIQGKQYDAWKPMQEENFVFSLYPNDLLHVTHKKNLKLSLANKESTLPTTLEAKEAFLYFISANISTAVISCRNHDNTYQIASLGVKTLEKLEKYTVTVLGEVHKVEKEPRMPFTCKEG